jgi:hypothetical protein
MAFNPKNGAQFASTLPDKHGAQEDSEFATGHGYWPMIFGKFSLGRRMYWV